jgi:uncharacterized alpha/beta hydrolase family protein
MIDTMDNTGYMLGKKTDTYYVYYNPQNYVHFSTGAVTDHPLIKISFQEGAATDSWNDEADRIGPVIENIKEKYGTKYINIVAHSQGGLVALDYMEKPHDTPTVVKKFVALGTPFNGSLLSPQGVTDLAPNRPRAQLGITENGAAHEALANTDVFVGFHTEQNIVVTESSQRIIKVANPKSYYDKRYNTGHGGIHESEQVINDVNYFLFQGID